MKTISPPLPCTSFAPRLGFTQSVFRHLRSWSALSFPSPLRSTFPSRLCGPVGNTSVSNFTTSSLFRIRKSIGCGYSSLLSQVSGSPSSSHPPPSTFLLFVPLPSYSYTHSPSSYLPLFPPPQLAPYCPLSAVDLRSLYKNLLRLRLSSWPSLIPFWHTHRGPLNRVSSACFPIVPSGIASFPGTAPVRR